MEQDSMIKKFPIFTYQINVKKYCNANLVFKSLLLLFFTLKTDIHSKFKLQHEKKLFCFKAFVLYRRFFTNYRGAKRFRTKNFLSHN